MKAAGRQHFERRPRAGNDSLDACVYAVALLPWVGSAKLDLCWPGEWSRTFPVKNFAAAHFAYVATNVCWLDPADTLSACLRRRR